MRLISRTGSFPPAGYLFTDPKTGMKFEHGDFKDIVSQIIKHRRANPRLYPPENAGDLDFNSVSNELDSYTVMRLHNDPRYCESGEPIPVSTEGLELMTMTAPCPKCGCRMGWQILCKTCSGKKRTGFYCADCTTLCPR